MNCRQCDHMLQRAAAAALAERLHAVTGWNEPLWPSGWGLRAEDQLLQREGTHFQKQLAFKYCLQRVSWWITVWSCQDKNDYKIADKGHLRTRKDYSSEVSERHVKTMRFTLNIHMRKTYLRLILQEDETANM